MNSYPLCNMGIQKLSAYRLIMRIKLVNIGKIKLFKNICYHI